MRTIFNKNCLIFTYLQCVLTLQVITKPSFHPYCATRKLCKQACSCEVAPNCTLLPMDEFFRNNLLKFHNQIRHIQTSSKPSPAGLSVLHYDPELEEVSTCWAVRCQNEYSECFVTSKYIETTQSVTQLVLNLEKTPNVFMWMQAMLDWVDLVGTNASDIIAKLPTGLDSEYLNNYGQLMSDQILAAGCAWSINVSSNVLHLVCTYGPRGPLQGEPIYKTGNPCSSCPEGYSCDQMEPYEHLCKLIEYPGVNAKNTTNQWRFNEGRTSELKFSTESTPSYHNEQKPELEEASVLEEDTTESIEEMYESMNDLPEGVPLSEEVVSPRSKVEEEGVPWDFTRSSTRISEYSFMLICILTIVRYMINTVF